MLKNEHIALLGMAAMLVMGWAFGYLYASHADNAKITALAAKATCAGQKAVIAANGRQVGCVGLTGIDMRDIDFNASVGHEACQCCIHTSTLGNPCVC